MNFFIPIVKWIWQVCILHPRIYILRALGAKIGRNCKILTPLSNIDLAYAALLEIEDDVTIAKNTMLFFHDGSLKRQGKSEVFGKIILKKNCFVGAGSVLLPGVTIGNNAIVGAGSIVTKNVRAGYIVAGNPAKEIVK